MAISTLATSKTKKVSDKTSPLNDGSKHLTKNSGKLPTKSNKTEHPKRQITNNNILTDVKKKQKVNASSDIKMKDIVEEDVLMEDRSDKDSVAADIKSDCNDNDLSVSQKRKFAKLEKLKHRNPAADFVNQCNILYAKLIDSKESTIEERIKKVQECLDFVDGFDISSSEAFAGKARLLSVNRCLQMCYKYGNKEQKKFMTDKLKSHFIRLASTDTACFLCYKMLKYNDPETQAELATMLISQTTNDLLFTKFGSKVVSHALSLPKPFPAESLLEEVHFKLCVPKVISLQIRDFKGKNLMQVYSSVDNRGKEQIKEHLDTMISRCIDKELLDRTYFHEVVHFYSKVATQTELKALADSLNECLLLLLSSRSGCMAICTLLNVMDAKSRKKFIQTWKEGQICPHDIAINDVSYLVLLKLFSVVDDTKLLKESVLGPAIGFDLKGSVSTFKKEETNSSILLSLCRNKFGRKCLYVLLTNNTSKYLTKGEYIIIREKSTSSKKDGETRRLELLNALLPALKCLFSNVSSTDLITDWLQDLNVRDLLIEYLRNSKDTALVDTLFEAFQTSNIVTDLFDHQTAQRTCISLIKIGTETQQQEQTEHDKDIVPSTILDGTLKNSKDVSLHCFLWDMFYESQQLLKNVLESRGIFIIMDLLTIVKNNQIKNKEIIKQFAKKCSSIISGFKSQTNTGFKLLNARLVEIQSS